MKEFIKCIFIVIIITCFFASCSKSGDDNDSKKKVISKITLKSLDDIDNGLAIYANQTFNFSYVNGEVSKIESDNYVYFFNYDNKKLLSVTYSNENIDTKTISYSNDKIIQTMTSETMNEFFYNEANKLNEIQSSYIDSNFSKKYSTKYFFLENNIIRTYKEPFINPNVEEITYKYDNKNNPYINHNINFRLIWGFETYNLSENNAIEEINGNKTINYSIIYDSEDYPIKVKGTDKKTGELWTEYKYEYIKI